MAFGALVQVTGLFLHTMRHSSLARFFSVAPAEFRPPHCKFCSYSSSDSSVKSVNKENDTLLNNLVIMGVDIKMVRKRQPGVLRKVITNERGVAEFLQSKGAGKEAIASIISRYPRAITRTFDHLEERWRLWRSIFNTDLDIVKVIDRSPESFFRSSDNENLKKNIKFLGSLGLTSKDLLRLLTTAPRTFSNSCELNKQMVEFLQDICFSLGGDNPDHFVKQLITRNVYILIRSIKRVKTNIEFLQTALSLTDEELLNFLQGPGANVLDLSNEYVKRNFRSADHKLLSLECSQQEVRDFIVNYAPALYVSPENLTSKIDCLLEAGIHINQILEKPRVLEFSLETIKRRIEGLKRAGYNFTECGIGILDSSWKRFEAKLEKLCVISEE